MKDPIDHECGASRRVRDNDGALIVFAREPLVGEVKSRLAAEIGDAEATQVYATLLSRALRLAEASQFATLYLFAAKSSQVEYFRARLDTRLWHIRAQCDGNIGMRMRRAIEAIFPDHAFVALIGSDIADGTLEDLDSACRRLVSSHSRTVVGPSVDGGYWLIGMNDPAPSVFEDIPWSTKEVLSTTLAQMAALDRDVHCLAPRHDVDEYDDLRFLQ